MLYAQCTTFLLNLEDSNASGNTYLDAPSTVSFIGRLLKTDNSENLRPRYRHYFMLLPQPLT